MQREQQASRDAGEKNFQPSRSKLKPETERTDDEEKSRKPKERVNAKNRQQEPTGGSDKNRGKGNLGLWKLHVYIREQ